MKITVCRQPSILHETVELVHAFVNQTPPEQLYGQGSHGITREEILRIMSIACADIDPTDEETQFFLQGIPFEDKKDGLSSIARNLVCAWAEEICADADEMAESLIKYRRKFQGTLRVKGVFLYGLNTMSNSRLLIKEVADGKSTCTTNYPVIQELFDLILQTLSQAPVS